MSPEVIMGLAIVGVIILALVVRWVVRMIFNKAEDAISNKLADRKNERSANQVENLADRYKK